MIWWLDLNSNLNKNKQCWQPYRFHKKELNESDLIMWQIIRLWCHSFMTLKSHKLLMQADIKQQPINKWTMNTATHSSCKVDHCGPYANECGGGSGRGRWIMANREQQSERRLREEGGEEWSGGRDRMMIPRGWSSLIWSSQWYTETLCPKRGRPEPGTGLGSGQGVAERGAEREGGSPVIIVIKLRQHAGGGQRRVSSSLKLSLLLLLLS